MSRLAHAWILGATLSASAAAAPAGEPLRIASGGKTDAVVVVSPEAAKGAERAAADDLAKYIGLMTGATPRVVSDRAAIDAALNGSAPVFLVGAEALKADPALAERLRSVAKKDPVLRADAVVLRRAGSRVLLAGTNDESHYYAVSALLHRWGCRWVMPTDFGECIPEWPELTLGDLDEAHAPPFEVRSYWISWNGDATGYEAFKRRNFMTDRSVGVPSGHCLNAYTRELVPPGRSPFNVPIAEERTARHVAAQVAEKYARGERFSLGMEDGNYQSDSPKDRELMALQYDTHYLMPSMTDSFMVFYNTVARLLREQYPRSAARIGFLAYSNITLPPVRVTRAEKALVAYLAPIDFDPIHGMDDPKSPPRQEYREILYQWAKLMEGRLVIYDYDQGMLVWRDIPNPSIQGLEQDFRHYRRAGILGVDTESRNATGTIFFNLYFRGQLLWNPDATVKSLLADLMPRFYGPAAGPMARFWDTLLAAWNDSIVTEHEYFVAPAIYTPAVVAALRRALEAAEAAVKPLGDKPAPTRNERLVLDRIAFMRLSFTILERYLDMVRAAAGACDYAAAAAAGEQGLAAREAMTRMNGTFTTYKTIGENGPAWWPGEVQQYKDLQALVAGPQGTLVAKLPLEWAFRRDPKDLGLKEGWGLGAPDLALWNEKGQALAPEARKDWPPDAWEVVRTDLYLQAQGIRRPDQQGFTGHGWYTTEVDLSPAQARRPLRVMFPGLFNVCWLYVNGAEAAHRGAYKPLWWLNDYTFEWDVDLTGKLKAGRNRLTLRIHNPHHFGGMFRRPFLYAPAAP